MIFYVLINTVQYNGKHKSNSYSSATNEKSF